MNTKKDKKDQKEDLVFRHTSTNDKKVFHPQDAAEIANQIFKKEVKAENFKLCFFLDRLVWYRKSRWHHFVIIGDNRLIRAPWLVHTELPPEEVRVHHPENHLEREWDQITIPFSSKNRKYKAVGSLQEHGLVIQEIMHGEGKERLLELYEGYVPESWDALIATADNAYDVKLKKA